MTSRSPVAAAPAARPLRLAIVSTHPIQYYAPLFRVLGASRRLLPRVFFTWSQTASGEVYDPGFDKHFTWDVPLLDGYDHVFVPNTAKRPGSDHFAGIRNPGLTGAISSWHADAVLVYGWNLQSHLQAMRHFKGRIPVLFRGDSTLLDPRSRMRRVLRRMFLRWVYSHVDVAVAVGQNNRDYYLWCGVRPDRIAIAPHSIDTVRFGDEGGGHDDDARRWRAELGIPMDVVTFVFAGKLMSKKDPILLLEAFLTLGRRAHLVMFGEGELAGELRRRAGGQTNVHMLPFQNQSRMPTVYRVGDVYVLPSRGPDETWGLAMNEAMASGRPVIASSRVGGARDLVRPEETGWIFEAGSAGDLVRVMNQAILRGTAGLQDMGGKARVASGRFSTEAAAEAIAAAVLRSSPQRQSAVVRDMTAT